MGDRRRETVYYIVGLLLLSSLWPCFFQGRELVRRPGDPGTFGIDKDEVRVTCVEYQRRMRERLLDAVGSRVNDSDRLLADARAGHYAGNSPGFEQRSDQVINDLRDSLTELNSRRVPPAFIQGHMQLAESHKWCYQAVKEVQQAYFEEDVLEQRRLFDSAQKKIRKARSLVQKGRADIQRHYG